MLLNFPPIDMSTDAIKSSINSLQQIYSVILALALGEAFKQVVAEGNVPEKRIAWEKLPNLVGLLALIIPFFHGMNRYFFEVYIARSFPGYERYLLIDCVAFTVEGGFFFLLARSLSRAESNRFYLSVSLLLFVDVLWGGVIHLHMPSVKPWVLLDFASVPIILLFVWLFGKKRFFPELGAILMIVRSACDYLTSWHFYFPSS